MSRCRRIVMDFVAVATYTVRFRLRVLLKFRLGTLWPLNVSSQGKSHLTLSGTFDASAVPLFQYDYLS